MQGFDCHSTGAVSSHLNSVMPGASMASHFAAQLEQQHQQQHHMEELWAHDFVMQHHHHIHMQHHHHHFDPTLAIEHERQWAEEFAQHHAAQQLHSYPAHAADIQHGDALDEALAAAYAEEAAFNAAGVTQGEAGAGADSWAQQFETADGEEWVQDYNDENVQVHTLDGEPLRTVDEKDAGSKFHALMSDIKSGDVIIEEPNEGNSGNMAARAAATLETEVNTEWANEYAMDPAEAEMRAAWQTAADGENNDMTAEFLQEMRAEAGEAEGEGWADEYGLDEHLDDGTEWVKEYEAMTQRLNEAAEQTEYPFEPNNAYIFHDAPFQEGLDLLAAGTLSEAVLAFEAACQKDPSSAEHWQFLGTTQAENEKDGLAIIALNMAKKLFPGNLHVLSALAVCHTNEANHRMALRYLEEWLAANEKYRGLQDAVVASFPAEEHAPDDFTAQYLFVDRNQHKRIVAMYEAAQVIDASDVEISKALGVLHNLSSNYDEAAECFRAAIKLCPDDDKLWNKLGATLANGNRPREAIEAYNKALDLNPGFVRCHYNLGVAYQTLGDYVNAARQFIRAIVMQQGGVQPPGHDSGPGRSQRSADSIWDILRMTFNLMDKSDLVEATWQHDVRPFLDAFGLSDIA